MDIFVTQHHVVADRLGQIRDKNTTSHHFRRLVEEISYMLGLEATSNIQLADYSVETPIGPTTAQRILSDKLLILPILRAGLGMLSGLSRVIPDVEVAFVGAKRNESSLESEIYLQTLPNEVSDRHALVLDPMIATAGTLIRTLDLIFSAGMSSATCISIIAAPEGLSSLREFLASNWPEKAVNLILAQLDEKLDDKGFISPGLGDAGDRLFGSL